MPIAISPRPPRGGSGAIAKFKVSVSMFSMNSCGQYHDKSHQAVRPKMPNTAKSVDPCPIRTSCLQGNAGSSDSPVKLYSSHLDGNNHTQTSHELEAKQRSEIDRYKASLCSNMLSSGFSTM